MPVQINEMIIRANIMEPVEKAGDINSQPQSNADKDEIIKQCTEIILEILKNKGER